MGRRKHPALPTFLFLIPPLFLKSDADMVLKTKIDGKIECFSEEDARACRVMLSKYRIKSSIDGVNIGINSELKVTPFFERKEFKNMLLDSTKKYGNPTLVNVGEIMEEKEDETAFKLLRQRRKSDWEKT